MSDGRADDPARRRIGSDFDTNLLVEAGAGSGKTHELVARMAAGIACGAYELERMAAVTFTRKAAAELRGRLQLALEAELDSAPLVTDGRTDRIRVVLGNLERFFAGTIHAFCSRLLRERPVEAGVSPGFTELDDVEERMVREQSWRDYRTQAKAIGDVDLLELLDAGLSAKQLDKAFGTLCLYEDVTFPTGDAPMPDATCAWAKLEAFWQSLDSLLPPQIAPDSTCTTQKRADRFRRQWRAHVRGRAEQALLADMLRTWESKPSVVQKYWPTKDIAKQAQQLHAGFRDAVVVPYLVAWRQYLYRRCVGLLTKARNAAKDERRRRNTLSFNDLLIVTADLLRTNAEVRLALQKKYRWLLVDEFQDTDPVQAEIMFLLAANESSGDITGTGPANWRTVPLRPGALFVVGDPKQSIYRFRRADIDIYSEVRARIGGADEEQLVSLTTSFRSVPGLCDWVNQVFKSHFPAAPTLQAPMFAALDADRVPVAGVPHLAVIDLPPGLDGSAVAGEEAARISRYIRSEVDAGRRKYGDFLILTRRKKGLKPYASALEALEVPIEVTGAGAFGESEEVRSLALLLGALCDPQDAVALVGVLRGPLFGISDRELFAFRQGGGYFNLFSTAAEPSAMADALTSLRRWHNWARRLPVGAALERILEDSGYLALGATSHEGVEAGDLLHAIDRVRAAVESGFALSEAATALAAWSGLEDDGIGDSTEVDSLPLEPGRREVVRLMNLHKAKGLEAAVVFLADPLGGFDPHVDVRILRSHHDSGAEGYFRIVDGWGYQQKILAEPEDWEAHEAAESAYLVAEVDRLMYVAATRARDTLVLGRCNGKLVGRPAWSMFTPYLGDAPALSIPDQVTLPAAPVLDLGSSAVLAARNNFDLAHDRVRRPTWSATSVTAEAKRLPRCGVPTAEEAAPAEAVVTGVDPTQVVIPQTSSHQADAGLAWGALVHGLLEHAMRHASATREDLRRLAMWLTMEEPSLRAVIDLALDTVQSFASTSFWQEARSSAAHHEEAPFAIFDADASPPRVVTGTLDLVHRTASGWRVVDYKTDVNFGDPNAQRTYAEQVRQYAEAWARVAGEATVTEVVGVRLERSL